MYPCLLQNRPPLPKVRRPFVYVLAWMIVIEGFAADWSTYRPLQAN